MIAKTMEIIIPVGIVNRASHPIAAIAQFSSWHGAPEKSSINQLPTMLIIIGPKEYNRSPRMTKGILVKMCSSSFTIMAKLKGFTCTCIKYNKIRSHKLLNGLIFK